MCIPEVAAFGSMVLPNANKTGKYFQTDTLSMAIIYCDDYRKNSAESLLNLLLSFRHMNLLHSS